MITTILQLGTVLSLFGLGAYLILHNQPGAGGFVLMVASLGLFCVNWLVNSERKKQ